LPAFTPCTQNITLDGVIDAAGGWFDPSGEEGADQSDVIEAIRSGIVLLRYRTA
jgi:hypothetical protein